MRTYHKLTNRLFQSAGIFFAALLVFAAIAYALTSWNPGNPPSADPGSGNVTPYFLIEARTSDPTSPQNGQIWLRTDL